MTALPDSGSSQRNSPLARAFLTLVLVISFASLPCQPLARANSCSPPLDSGARISSLLPLAGGGCLALVEVEAEVGPVAVIWRFEEDWKERAEAAIALDGYGWVGAATEGPFVIAVADAVVEAPAGELLVALSKDLGATWDPPVPIQKPYYMAWLADLRLEPDGSARLSLRLDEDYGSPFAPGLYCYRITPGAAGWSAAGEAC